MTTVNWYADEVLVEQRKLQLEHDARLAAERHLGRRVVRGRRFGRRR